MLKLLLVVGVIAFVYYFFIKKKPITSNSSSKKKAQEAEVEDMVECATCETYCEISEAILSNGKYYCSQECLGKA